MGTVLVLALVLVDSILVRSVDELPGMPQGVANGGAKAKVPW
jgi:hypothetical protein